MKTRTPFEEAIDSIKYRILEREAYQIGVRAGCRQIRVTCTSLCHGANHVDADSDEDTMDRLCEAKTLQCLTEQVGASLTSASLVCSDLQGAKILKSVGCALRKGTKTEQDLIIRNIACGLLRRREPEFVLANLRRISSESLLYETDLAKLLEQAEPESDKLHLFRRIGSKSTGIGED